MFEFQNRTRTFARTLLAFTAALSIGVTGAIFGGTTPASAAPLNQHSFVFTDPTGTDWVVPDGVTEVLVGLRGGDGGCVNCSQPGGKGQSYLLQLAVTPGDTLTVFPGTTPKSFARDAGLGFVNGGKGGDKSRSAEGGSGGGGASAVKLNGELLAVAGGGGGGGGRGGDREFRPFSYDFDFGGRGGDAVTYDGPTWGEGKHAGNPGENARDDSKFSGYHKPGGNGGSAGTLTSGGGGGAGGGGWPASGTGGGAGKKRLGFGAGSGGGAGMSWLNTQHPALTVLETSTRPDFDFWYTGPLARENQANVTIPLRTETVLTGPEALTADAPFEVRARTIDPIFGDTPVDGSYELLRDGATIAQGTTDGDLTLAMEGLAPGDYVFTYRFTPTHKMGPYWTERATTSTELRVVVGKGVSEDTSAKDAAASTDAVPAPVLAPEGAEPESSDTATPTETSEVIGDDDSCDVTLPVTDTVVPQQRTPTG